MTDLDAIDIIEGDDSQTTDEQQRAAWQALVDSGTVWHLQGFYGRTAARMLDAGILRPATVEHTDAYGNRLPANVWPPNGGRHE